MLSLSAAASLYSAYKVKETYMIEISYTQTPEEDGLYCFQDMGFEEYAKQHGILCDYKPFGFSAKENGRTVGAITGNSYYNEVHISELMVDKDCRGRDIGTKLVKAVEEHFTGKGYENINLTTYGFQAPEFYKKCGYKVEYIRKSKNDPKLDKYFMIKHL